MLITKEEFDFLTELNRQAIKRHREGKKKNVRGCDECVKEGVGERG